MTSTTVEYSKSESDKKSDALISSTENQCTHLIFSLVVLVPDDNDSQN